MLDVGRSSLLTPAAFGKQLFQSRAIAFQHEPVRAGHCFQRRIRIDSQEERVVQTTGALQYRAAATAASENRNGPVATGDDIDLPRDAIRISDNDEVFLWFPEAK